MLYLLYSLLDKIGNKKIKKKIYVILGIFGNLYISILYWLKYSKKNKNKIKGTKKSEVIVSLTSFPGRIDKLHLTICSLLEQSFKPDRLILWLADSQFSSLDKIPQKLLNLTTYGLEICFCEDLLSHKKYYYTFKNFPNSTIITVDDDIIYPKNTIQKLIETHKQYPNSVCCNRGHEIKFQNRKVSKYDKWIKEAIYLNYPTFLLCPTGSGGVLYPPGCVNKEVYNKRNIYQLSLLSDDIWLKFMELLQGTKAVYTNNFPQWLFTVGGTQSKTLAMKNVDNGNNDCVVDLLLKTYNINLFDICMQN